MTHNSNNIYKIFIFSLLFHVAVIVGITNIKFQNNIQQNLSNNIEIDVQTTEQNQHQLEISNIPLPSPNINTTINDIKNVKIEKFTEITPPDIDKISINNQKVVKNNLLSIPSNIPFKITKSTKETSQKTSQQSKGKGKNIDKILKNYLYSIRSKIEKSKKYPLIARKMGIEGVTNVEFVIFKSGKLSIIKIYKSSGSEILDKAAVKAVKNAQPFSHIPAQLSLNKMKIKLKIVFKIE